MTVTLSKKLCNAYTEHGRNLDYSLSFILSSMDPDTCAEGMLLPDSFTIDGDSTDVEINEKHIRAITGLFGSADTKIITKLLWVALLFPEI